MQTVTIQETTSVPVPSIGRVVHYVLPQRAELRHHIVGELRPATIIKVWGADDPDAAIQLAVFLDGQNDKEGWSGEFLWATSVRHDEVNKEPGTWHWPEFVPNIVREVPEKDEVTSDG
jgi:hypothetical protein